MPDAITKLGRLRSVFLEVNANLTSMPANWSRPTCVAPNGEKIGDCCNLSNNNWKCPIPAWTKTSGGGLEDECNSAAQCS